MSLAGYLCTGTDGSVEVRPCGSAAGAPHPPKPLKRDLGVSPGLCCPEQGKQDVRVAGGIAAA